jgi:uncharacterized damage-inducible protein DinB
MYCTIKDFLDDWSYEHEATIKVFASLTDESLGQRVTPKGRSLGKLAWHIVISIGEMITRTGLVYTGPGEDAPQPATAAAIADAYRRAGYALAHQVGQVWKDADLLQKVEMYRNEQWEKRAVLAALVRHQVHHRAQMTVLMRQAGLAVPGCYGPSSEEWTAFGMPPQE